jgi:hypothetical protein
MSLLLHAAYEAQKPEWRRHDCRIVWRRVAQMKTKSNTLTPERVKSPWFQVGQFLFLVGLAVAVFMLGLSMVHHRFVQGGRIDRYGHIKR